MEELCEHRVPAGAHCAKCADAKISAAVKKENTWTQRLGRMEAQQAQILEDVKDWVKPSDVEIVRSLLKAYGQYQATIEYIKRSQL